MMCSKLLTAARRAETGLTVKVDALFQRVSARYRRLLDVHHRPAVDLRRGHARRAGAVAACSPGSAQGAGAAGGPRRLLHHGERPEGAGFDYTVVADARRSRSACSPFVERGDVDRVNVRTPRGMGGVSSEDMNTGQAIVILKPWDERDVRHRRR